MNHKQWDEQSHQEALMERRQREIDAELIRYKSGEPLSEKERESADTIKRILKMMGVEA